MGIQNPASDNALSIRLPEGRAELMGDGIFVMMQRDPDAGGETMQSVVLSVQDLRVMENAAGALTLALDDGEAHYMGDGIHIVLQRDCTRPGHSMQNVVITANDRERILAAVA